MTRMRKAMALRAEEGARLERVRCLGWTFEVGSADVGMLELEGYRELQGLN